MNTQTLKLALLSDIHGTLCKIPPCDIVIIAGDILPEMSAVHQWAWYQNEFLGWANQLPTKAVVFIAGNHDFAFDPYYGMPHPNSHEYPNIHYLQDEPCKVFGFKVWGCPWSLPFGSSYRFMCEESVIKRKLDMMAPDTDILICHGPPRFIGDVGYLNEHAGSIALRDHIATTKPPLVVVGHIHEGRGIYQFGESIIVNAASLRPIHDNIISLNDPIIVNWRLRGDCPLNPKDRWTQLDIPLA